MKARAFIPQLLPEERARPQDINVNVRLNEEWQATLQAFKSVTGIDSDSTALKLALKLANNVLQMQFSNKIKAELTLGRQAKNSQGSIKK
ncbi:MAG: hypothetical protein WC852_07795 [Candidatus Nanoarchaeia archaeon]|jgi:hypothetical protein